MKLLRLNSLAVCIVLKRLIAGCEGYGKGGSSVIGVVEIPGKEDPSGMMVVSALEVVPVAPDGSFEAAITDTAYRSSQLTRHRATSH